MTSDEHAEIEEYWQLIASARGAVGDSAPAIRDELFNRLVGLEPEELLRLESAQTALMRRACSHQMQTALVLIKGSVTGDQHSVATNEELGGLVGWLITRGRAQYAEAVSWPDYIGGYLGDDIGMKDINIDLDDNLKSAWYVQTHTSWPGPMRDPLPDSWLCAPSELNSDDDNIEDLPMLFERLRLVMAHQCGGWEWADSSLPKWVNWRFWEPDQGPLAEPWGQRGLSPADAWWVHHKLVPWFIECQPEPSRDNLGREHFHGNLPQVCIDYVERFRVSVGSADLEPVKVWLADVSVSGLPTTRGTCERLLEVTSIGLPPEYASAWLMGQAEHEADGQGLA